MSKWRNIVQRVWPWSVKSGSYGIQELYAELLGRTGGSTKSGAQVNTQTALEVTAVLACVRVIAEGIAQVPFRVMRDEPRGDGLPPRKIPVANHPLTRLFAVEPNEWMTAYEFRETLSLHAALIGNAYAFIVRGVGGKVIELLPLEPHTVQVERDGWNVVYKVTFPTGESRIVPPENMWHWKGPSWNTYSGLKAVQQAREAIGLAMTAEELQGKSFANGARPSGILSTVAALTEEQIKEIRSNWESAYGGAANSFKTAIMYGDWKFTPTSSTNQDTQLLQTRQVQIEEICRAFRVMPIMIGYQGDKSSTYASAEQMFLAHIVHTLMPWYARIEQSAAKALLTPAERERGMYFKHFAQGMMRGSMTERVAYYTSMYNMAAMSPNEIRALEDMNPHEDGDDYVAPMNMAKPGEQVPPDPGAAPNRPGGPSGAAGSAQQRRTAGEGKHLGFEPPRSEYAEPSVLRGAADSAQKQLLNANAAAQVALANLMVKAAWNEAQHPRDDAGRFTANGGSAVDAFDPKEIESNRYVQWKSREKLVEMPIDTFLLLAKPGHSDDKEQTVRELRAAGTRFSTLPFLQFWGEGADRKIDGHEGRHRARQLKAEGYTTMPVLLRGDIRWSEQSDARRFDYREVWPTALRSETGEHNVPFPVPREQANWPYNGDGRLKSDGTKGDWREEDHPRAPAGDEDGGQFVSGGGGSARRPNVTQLRKRWRAAEDELNELGVYTEQLRLDGESAPYDRVFPNFLSMAETVDYMEATASVVKDLNAKGVDTRGFFLSNMVANPDGGAYDAKSLTVYVDSRANVQASLDVNAAPPDAPMLSHCKVYEDVIRHEIGHYVGIRDGNPTGTAIRRHINELIDDNDPNTSHSMKKALALSVTIRETQALGTYAASSPEEFFAEAFSYYYSKHYQPNKLPGYIEALVVKAGHR